MAFAVVLVTPWAAPEGTVAAVAMIVCLFVALGTLAVLSLATRTVTDLPGDVLDERARRVRDGAYRVAHRLLAIPLFGAGFALYALAADTPLVLTGVQAQSVPMLALLHGLLPTAVLAWTEPDSAVADPSGTSAGGQDDGRDLRALVARAALGGLAFFAVMLGFAAVEDGWSPTSDLLRTAGSASVFTVLMLVMTRWIRRRL